MQVTIATEFGSSDAHKNRIQLPGLSLKANSILGMVSTLSSVLSEKEPVYHLQGNGFVEIFIRHVRFLEK